MTLATLMETELKQALYARPQVDEVGLDEFLAFDKANLDVIKAELDRDQEDMEDAADRDRELYA